MTKRNFENIATVKVKLNFSSNDNKTHLFVFTTTEYIHVKIIIYYSSLYDPLCMVTLWYMMYKYFAYNIFINSVFHYELLILNNIPYDKKKSSTAFYP